MSPGASRSGKGPPARPIRLSRPDQVRAVRGPTAHQVVSVMERLRRASVAELGRHTGIPAASLYYHVRRLVRAGVLREHARRRTGGRDEVVYEMTGSEVVLDPKAEGPRFLEELRASLVARLRALERGFLAAVGHPRSVRSGRGRNLSLHQHHARLGPRDRGELQRRIRELEQFLIERDDPGREDFLHVTIAVHPVLREGG